MVNLFDGQTSISKFNRVLHQLAHFIEYTLSHLDMAEHVRGWAKEHFDLYSDDKYLSPTVTNVHNTKGIDVVALNAELAKRGAMLSNGYGDLKGTCFRIAHMGDLQVADVKWLTEQIDDIFGL